MANRRSVRRRTRPVAMIALAALGLAGCTQAADDGADLQGQHIEVLAVWSGAEQQQFERVIADFQRLTGVSVTYSSAGHGVPAELATRLAEDRLPDVAFLPQPGLLRTYAADHRLVALDDITGDLVARNYSAVWRGLGSAGGHLYGVWFKAANKSLVWYDIGAFERAGMVPPQDVEGLLAVEDRFAQAGIPAFSVAGADAWTLTDWFENIYLRSAGPARYDQLADHRIPWTDPSVLDALRLLARILDPAFVAGGVDGALSTPFEASVQRALSVPSAAAMVFEGDFVAGAIRSGTRAELGVDVDVFPFPAVGHSAPTVVAGGDAAVLMRRSDAGAAFLRYLATTEAAGVWSAKGGFLSPNLNLDLSVYPDDITRSMARSLLEAGDGFRFDLSDLQPAAFGATAGAGMRGLLQEFLRTGDVAGTAARLEAGATAAFGR